MARRAIGTGVPAQSRRDFTPRFDADNRPREQPAPSNRRPRDDLVTAASAGPRNRVLGLRRYRDYHPAVIGRHVGRRANSEWFFLRRIFTRPTTRCLSPRTGL